MFSDDEMRQDEIPTEISPLPTNDTQINASDTQLLL